MKEDEIRLIKKIDVNYDTKISYIVSSIMHIMNKDKDTRIYIYKIKNGDKPK